MVLEKAKRLVEHKRDVVICSIAYASGAGLQRRHAPSGKVLSGGIDANGLAAPAAFLRGPREISRREALSRSSPPP